MSPDTWLTRAEAAEALTKHGHPVNRKMLENLSMNGGGPPYVVKRLNGRGNARCVYLWADLKAWSERYRAARAPRARGAKEIAA